MSQDFFSIHGEVDIKLIGPSGELKQEVHVKNSIVQGSFLTFCVLATGDSQRGFWTLVASSFPGYYDPTYGDYYIRDINCMSVGAGGRTDINAEWELVANSTYMIDIGTFDAAVNNYTATVPYISNSCTIGAGYEGTVKTLMATSNMGFTRSAFLTNWASGMQSSYGQYIMGVIVLQPSQYIVKGTSDSIIVNWNVYLSSMSTMSKF